MPQCFASDGRSACGCDGNWNDNLVVLCNLGKVTGSVLYLLES